MRKIRMLYQSQQVDFPILRILIPSCSSVRIGVFRLKENGLTFADNSRCDLSVVIGKPFSISLCEILIAAFSLVTNSSSPAL